MRVIVVGGGEVGRTIAARLANERNDVTLIDADVEKVREIGDHLDVEALVGNGSSPTTLLAAGLESAEMVIAVTNSDEVNLLACLMAQTTSASTVKIARLRDPDLIAHSELLRRAGLHLDLVINPERVTAQKIRRLLEVPAATDVVPFADGEVLLLALRIPASSPLAGARLIDLAQLRPAERVLFVAINRGGEVLIPKGKDKIQADDVVYAITSKDGLGELQGYLDVGARKVRRVIIHGGGYLTRILAADLVSDGMHVKIIEPDVEECRALSTDLEGVMVLHGEGADPELLQEEGVSGCDAYIALTPDQESNILSALLAKRLGARSVHALIERGGFAPLAAAIGVDVPLSPRLTAVSSILHFVRRGKTLSVASFSEEQAEAIEIQAMETSSIVGRPLREVHFPKGAIIGAVVRGEEIIIAGGDTVIEPGDRVIIFALTSAIKEVEKAVSVSLEFF